jgi:hypothetical protein
MHAFLDNLYILYLSSDEKTNMDASISDDEATLVIQSMQSGKAPGPDGFPIAFPKAFSSKLSPILNSMYNGIFSSQKLPQTVTQATILLLLKKDPVDCVSYRPISLIKVLSRHLVSDS